MKSDSGTKKPSSCPISSSRITPSANWRENTPEIAAGEEGDVIAPEGINQSSPFVHEGAAKVLFTCLSISVTSRPTDDIFWFTKCKMA